MTPEGRPAIAAGGATRGPGPLSAGRPAGGRPPTADHHPRILIVDDEPHNRQLLEVMLGPESYVLECAASGDEALQIVSQQPPDLILLDVMMPGMDGNRVTRTLKDDPATAHIPIIMVTALDQREARLLALASGAEDFLTKPVDRAELTMRVRNLLRLKAYGEYYDKYSQMLEAEVLSRTSELLEHTNNLQRQAAVLSEHAALLQLAQDAIVVRDMQGRVLSWSHGAEAMYGWLPQEALGRELHALLRTELPRPQEEIDAELLQNGVWEGEIRHHTRDGTPLTVAVRLALQRNADGTAARYLSISNDITGRKQADEDLRTARNAADAANRAKSEFLANMSHEIRTPMNGVIGMTDLVLDTVLTSEQREYLRIVKSSADALLTVINDILDFSRMEAGRLELDPIDFNFRDTIGDTANTLAWRAHQQHLELIVDIDAALPLTLRGDPGRLRQVLVNLLGNAVKFTPHGEVVLRVVPEQTTATDVMVRFSVSDTGVGIPLARQQSIFEAFTQADGSTTRTYGGTGLGLTISAQLVQLMGGRIWVESEGARGSTFYFTARFGTAIVAAPARAVPDLVDLRGLRVLIVDDSPTNRSLVQEMVLNWEMLPAQAASVPDALHALRAAQGSGTPFSLVLTDSHMPDANGFTLAAAMKEDPELRRATIVMLTSAGVPGDATRCRELGIAAYLPKPIRRAALHDALMLALGERPEGPSPRPLVTRHSLREIRPPVRILLVDDDGVSQLLARRVLEKRGFTVTVARNGREALASLDQAGAGRFGCVLMDIHMPEMDGLACTAAVRERERTTHVHLPIIAMTADVTGEDEARCRAAGMDAYLTKPLVLEELFDVVDRHVGASTIPAYQQPAR